MGRWLVARFPGGEMAGYLSPYDKNRPLRVICRAGKRPEITVSNISLNSKW